MLGAGLSPPRAHRQLRGPSGRCSPLLWSLPEPWPSMWPLLRSGSSGSCDPEGLGPSEPAASHCQAESPRDRPGCPAQRGAVTPGRMAGADKVLTCAVAAAHRAAGRERPPGRGGVPVAAILLQELRGSEHTVSRRHGHGRPGGGEPWLVVKSENRTCTGVNGPRGPRAATQARSVHSQGSLSKHLQMEAVAASPPMPAVRRALPATGPTREDERRLPVPARGLPAAGGGLRVRDLAPS